MKGDFTRSTFKPEKHYSSVRMQQGRVQLDADWNEQIDINSHRIEKEARDIIGPCGAPEDGGGFKIDTASANKNLIISQGSIYVDGLLCENFKDIDITGQEDLPNYKLPGNGGIYLAYLDVWQRHMTAIEDPEIREVALGGPDTATRTKTVWQVKLKFVQNTPENGGTIDCEAVNSEWNNIIEESDGELTAFTKQETPSKNPCIVTPGAGYRRLENQLYRVEIHKGGKPDEAKFKWSRDNGSVVFAVEEFVKDASDNPTNKLKVKQLGKDKTLSLQAGDWVEVLDDATELSENPAGTLAQITENPDVAGRIITLDLVISGFDMKRHPRVRRWDQQSDAISVTPPSGSDSIELEDGIYVRFSGNSFKAGDYWLIPARTATENTQETGKIEWPRDESKNPPEPASLPLEGIRHHYCRLAVLQQYGSKNWKILGDCRKLFPAVTELTNFFHVCGDGQEAMPGKELPDEGVLQVGVANGEQPVKATVRFQIIRGNGTITSTDGLLTATGEGNHIEVLTDDGIASCKWKLDTVTQRQQVEATLRDACDHQVNIPIRFNANLSVAGEVAYTPPGCTNIDTSNGIPTVQELLKERVSGWPPVDEAGNVTVKDVLDTLLCKLYAGEVPYNPVIKGDRWKDINEISDLGTPPAPNTVQDALDDLVANLDSSDIPYRPQNCGTAASPTVRSLLNISASADSKVKDILDALLCDFNATDIPIQKDNTLCNRLKNDVNVKTVQDALNVLCKGIGGCAVTVGKGGKYERLDEAIKALLEENQTEICICLLPGDYELPGLEIQSEILHVKIVGCGPGTRIKLGAQLKLGLLKSFTLRDVELRVTDIGESIIFDQCDEITLESCRFMGEYIEALILIKGANRIHLNDNRIEAYRTSFDEAPNAGIESLSTAIVIADGGADTAIENNEIVGALSLYGMPGEDQLNEEDLKRLAELLQKNAIAFSESQGTLQLRNNRLTRLVLASSIIRFIKKPCEKEELEPVYYYKRSFFTDNVIEADRNQFLAQHQAFVSNSFSSGKESGTNAGVVIGESVIFSGNIASSPKIYLYNASRSNRKAANLIHIIDMFTLPRIWDETKSLPVPFIWNVHNFEGFDYDIDDNLGKEELRVLQPDLSANQRIIDLNNLVYTTGIEEKRLKVIEKAFHNNVSEAAAAGLQGTNEGEGFENGNYNFVGLGGIRYAAIKGKINKLSRLILEHGASAAEKKTLTVGETWDIGGGWILTAQSIDAKANPRQVWLVLSKDGVKKDDMVIAQGRIYTYIENSLAGESGVPVFVTYVDSVFAGATSDMVQLKYTWLIDTSITEIKAGDKFGMFKVVSMDTACMSLQFRNTDTIVCLTMGATVDLIGNFKFVVANRADVLRFMPTVEALAVLKPGPITHKINMSLRDYDIRGPIWNEVPLLGAVGGFCNTAEWDVYNLAIFNYDLAYDLGKQKLEILQTDLSTYQRTIDKGNLVYSTGAQPKMLKVVEEAFNGDVAAAAAAGLERTGAGEPFENGNYFVFGLLQNKAVALNGKIDTPAHLVMEQDADGKIILAVGETMEIGDGWTLMVEQINANTKEAFIVIGKDGVKRKEKVSEKKVYTYIEKSVGDETDVPLFVTYIDRVFAGATSTADMVQFRYTWAISPYPEKIKVGLKIGIFEVVIADNERRYIELRNFEPMNLDQNTIVDVIGNIRFKVADSTLLRFMPVTSRLIKVATENISHAVDIGHSIFRKI